MLIIFIKESGQDSEAAKILLKSYPESSVFAYKQHSDQELLEAVKEPALIILDHKMAIPHTKLLRMGAGDRLLRIMVLLEEGFGMHAVNARIAGADLCMVMPLQPNLFLRAIQDEGSTLRRMQDGLNLIKDKVCINRRYSFMQLLGAGRHSVMILARDLLADSDVTIKLLRKSLAGSAEYMEEFRVLVERFKAIDVPNMVGISDYGEWNGYVYIALNIGKAENLYEIMAKRKVPLQEIAKVGLAVTRALIAIKKQAVIHFDIKPENILFYKNQYYLSEFGSMLPFGKPDFSGYHYWPDSAFTCPESFIENADFTVRSDVYSLGLVLYTLASRQNPFAGYPCNRELTSRVSENIIHFQDNNPLIACPPLAITIEAMCLVRHDSRPRLRDLEIIFYQLYIILSDGKDLADLPGASALQTSRASTISSAAADGEKDGEEHLIEKRLRSSSQITRKEARRGGSVNQFWHNLAKKKKIMVSAMFCLLCLALFGIGYGLARKTFLRLYFKQGPLRLFTCYRGHTEALRTLDLRNARCPKCNLETTPSYTCNACDAVFGLTLWPRRDMSEEERREFEEKLKLCPFCKSDKISPTPINRPK